MLSEEIKEFLHKEALNRFLRYVQIWTTSDEHSQSNPSSQNQFDLGKILASELMELNLENVAHDEYGYVYGNLPASTGLEEVKPIGLIAHIDTSPAVNGKNVKPVIHKNYDGSPIEFASNPDIKLTIDDSPILLKYVGLDIVTSEGDTLLGADDKAGIAEIMATCAAWKRFSELKHGPVIICFTPDEEVGRGTSKINIERLPDFCYTLDGSEMGELESECFDAWKAAIKFTGLSVHPGYAKNLLINAIHVASRYLSEIPDYESPEHTEEREGFYYLSELSGNVEEANAKLIIRDFEEKNNQKRMEYLQKLGELYEFQYPGLKVNIEFLHQYKNMQRFIEAKQNVVDLAKKAIEMAGLDIKIRAIRGGTDGSKLSEMGKPTPNIFSGGLLSHSRKEHIPTLALQKASEVLIYLAELWISA
ncbi:MAG TPA: peptidase T [Candidatus Nanopelagicaceae bacterium]|nr:peptidase T [Candidatus Nanopelagicaceae bacterium]